MAIQTQAKTRFYESVWTLESVPGREIDGISIVLPAQICVLVLTPPRT